MEKRAKEAAAGQVKTRAVKIEKEHRQAPAGKSTREERLVIRLTTEELRRITTYCLLNTMPVSTWARSELLAAIRRA